MRSLTFRAMSRRTARPSATVVTCAALAFIATQGGASAGGGTVHAPAAVVSSQQSAARSLFLADLTTDELRAAVAEGFTTALVYSGSTEGTGPALALGKHNVRAPYYAERIARELGHTVVGQVVPFGVNAEPLTRTRRGARAGGRARRPVDGQLHEVHHRDRSLGTSARDLRGAPRRAVGRE